MYKKSIWWLFLMCFGLTIGGIHQQELLVDNRIDLARLEALCRKLGATPDFAIAHLGW